MAVDAWKQIHNIYKKHTKQWNLRPDIEVVAHGAERCVSISVGRANPKYDPKNIGIMNNRRWLFNSRRGNVSTMRELALILWEACDAVDASNPEWARHDGAPPLELPAAFLDKKWRARW